jgi:large subunit ribosomal protein L13
MTTLYFKKELHTPKWFLIDATGKTLGRLASEISKLLIGKHITFFTPGLDQGNYLIVINSLKIRLTGKKEIHKLYYSNKSQRPGKLKTNNIQNFKENFPQRILKKAVWGMVPKNILGRKLFTRLYIYKDNQINCSLIKNSKLLHLINL